MKKNWYIGILGTLLFFAACQAMMVPQTPEITKKYFPDPEIPMNTPAFKKDKGFTTYAEMMSFLNAQVEAHPHLYALSFIGNSQKGVEIPMISIHHPANREKVKVWIQAGLHGNEPAGVEAMLYLLDELHKPQYAEMLSKLDIRILPMANIDGCEKNDRYSANGLDLNRDQTKIAAPETRSIKTAFSSFSPQVCLDLHEFRPYRRDFTQMGKMGVTNGYDAMFLFSGNLNVPKVLRDYTENQFVEAAKKRLEGAGMTHHNYFTADKYNNNVEMNLGSIHARSTATSAALTNCVSTLLEVRGIGLGKTSYKRRVYSTWLVVLSYLESAANNSEELKGVLKQALEPMPEDSAYVKQKRKVYQQELEFIELEHNTKTKLEVTIHDALQSFSVLSRVRPQKYFIEPDQVNLIDRLQVLGLVLTPLEKETSIQVDQFSVKAYSTDPIKWEQVQLQNAETELLSVTKTFPPGTLVLDMNQSKSNLAIELLEPEASNSLVHMHIIDVQQGSVLPYYRYPSQK